MSLDLRVRLSDIVSSEQEMDKQLEAANSNGVTVEDTPTMSVKDARKRFEQLSASTATVPSTTSSGKITSGNRTAPRPAIKKQKPLEKSESVPQPTEKKKVLQKAKTDSLIADNNHTTAASNNIVNDKGESSKPQSKSKSFKKLPFVKRSSELTTKVTRASSDAEVVEKKNKHRSAKKKVEEPKTKAASGGSSSTNSPQSPPKSPTRSLTTSTSAPTTPRSTKKLSERGFSLLSKSKGDSNKKTVAETKEKQEGAAKAEPIQKSVEMDEGEQTKETGETGETGETKARNRPESPRLIKEGEYKITLAEGESVSSECFAG